MNGATKRPLGYRDAGVDIERGHRLVERLKPIARRTHGAGVLAGIGGFGALFELPVDRYRRPVLVSGADGVGTKLRVAIDSGVHGTIGIDLVAMCANDVLALGAEPLFFLDYYAAGRLDLDVAEAVVAGIARGCELAGAALIGGESAEMPGLYAEGDYDLAGFCVGVVERDAVIDGSRVAPGHALVGLASSGLHANGFSLVRKIVEISGAELSQPLHGASLAQTLLTPTRIYVEPVRRLIDAGVVRAIAHITGGGLVENVPRVLPAGTAARIEVGTWERPPIFDWLEAAGQVAAEEMLRTFNCGIGLVVCVAREDLARTLSLLERAGETAWEIGSIEPAAAGAPGIRLE